MADEDWKMSSDAPAVALVIVVGGILALGAVAAGLMLLGRWLFG